MDMGWGGSTIIGGRISHCKGLQMGSGNSRETRVAGMACRDYRPQCDLGLCSMSDGSRWRVVMKGDRN